jgi:hypothetical protein
MNTTGPYGTQYCICQYYVLVFGLVRPTTKHAHKHTHKKRKITTKQVSYPFGGLHLLTQNPNSIHFLAQFSFSSGPHYSCF